MKKKKKKSPYLGGLGMQSLGEIPIKNSKKVVHINFSDKLELEDMVGRVRETNNFLFWPYL
jgi:hypothetical protein